MTDHQITIEEIKLLIDSKRAQIRIVEGLLETQRNDLRDLNSMKMSLSSLEVEEEGQQQELPTFGQGETFSNPSSSASEDAIQKIVNLFRRNVKGKAPELSGYNSKHDGKRGHWLEKQMGISHNSQNKADLFGFEMKDDSKSKTTFGESNLHLQKIHF